MSFSSRLACSLLLSSDENAVCLSVPAFLGFRGVGVPDCVVVISSVHLIRSVLRAVPLPALVRCVLAH